MAMPLQLLVGSVSAQIRAPSRQGVFTPAAETLLQRPRTQRASVHARGMGKDAFQGWIDVSHLVSGGAKTKTAYDKLASLIGKDVHVDVNGWHLFLRDITVAQGIKMDQALAQAIGPDTTDKGYPDKDLEDLLKKIPLELGKGKVKISLFDAIPQTAFRNFSNAINDYARDL